MNNKKIFILAVVLIASVVLAGCGPSPLTVTIKGEDIKYDVTSIGAKVGQAVTVNLVNAGALDHSFVIDELNVSLTVKPGETGTVTFTPQTAGTYTYYCHIPGHKELMFGTLMVSP